MNIGDDVRVDVGGTVTAVEPGRLTIRATEGGAVWTVGTVVDVPAGAVVEQAAKPAPRVCEGFRWIGQSFAHCDRCGEPYWEHTHDEQLNRDVGPFAPDPWMLVPITPEQAEATRRKWSA